MGQNASLMRNCVNRNQNHSEYDPIQRKKNDQGNHECEVLGRGPEAAEVANLWDNCTKNPGHTKFIPVSEFCVDHLPECCRNISLLQYIQTICDLTVRLRVTYTSCGRPKNYPFSKYGGSDIQHTGSGWVYDIKLGAGSCPCPGCSRSTSPSPIWYKVYIRTACHVVYDAEESRKTMVDFFYDDENSRALGKMKTFWGKGVAAENDDSDSCIFFFATHDQTLADQLLLRRKQLIENQVLEHLDHSRLHPFHCFIVSHPHGQTKKISVGRVSLKENEMYTSPTRIDYITATCTGSSGAPVLICTIIDSFQMRWIAAPHSQWRKEMAINQSAISPALLSYTNSPLSQIYFGLRETYADRD
ncbi:hypothetical protein PoB_002298300 [Plakobranchus ocellatus]|uniref:Uncharacterized protein n=1 Tax=Plakobranchus ocellatus TaxID=259542 RepID=A0AAV3ZPI3_9GAST|nr:hypothetical protein PoB_002298300 [Plakobranchus ocellatus]